MLSIDLNCDMGEGMAGDAAIMPYISSVNIACGAHAGDAATMQRTIDLALQYNVAIGAHPGFADTLHFGRTAMQLSGDAYYDLVRDQLRLLQKYIDAAGAGMHHVKPHGALYNMSATGNALAAVIARAVKDHDPSLILYGLSNSCSVTEAAALDVQTASEVFADRTYMDDGTLTPRANTSALITDHQQSAAQVLQMVMMQTVTSVNNKIVPVHAETVCIHGDGLHAAGFAKLIFASLRENNIQIRSV